MKEYRIRIVVLDKPYSKWYKATSEERALFFAKMNIESAEELLGFKLDAVLTVIEEREPECL